MSVEQKVVTIEQQIAALKDERDKLLRTSGLMSAEIERLLRMRTHKRTLCQLLRELHDVLGGTDREKVEQALLIAKKMDERLVHYAGQDYTTTWYDREGKFVG